MNRVVAQAFQPAGLRDFLVPCSGIRELATGKSPEPAGWKACATVLPPLRLMGSMRELFRGRGKPREYHFHLAGNLSMNNRCTTPPPKLAFCLIPVQGWHRLIPLYL
jgi:hypothetical protein